MAEEMNGDDRLRLPVKSLVNVGIEESVEFSREKILFFGSRYQRRASTWFISLFVVLSLVTFFATMFVNDCAQNSNGDCMLKSLRRLSFQPIRENPLIGPSSSTLAEMGALQWTSVMQQHQKWRLVTCFWLHAGVIHLILNLSSVALIGIHLEQLFGPLRIGIISLLSAFLGSLFSALFVQHDPVVGSSGALFGLLGAMLSGLIRDWGVYADKVAAIVALAFITVTNFALGLLPHVGNFSSMGGFLSGVLLGCVLLFNPQLGQLRNKGIFEFKIRNSPMIKQKLDKPALRIVSLALFATCLVCVLVAVLHEVNGNEYCSWCHYIDCIPSKRWSCSEMAVACEARESQGRLTLTCKDRDRFQIYSFANITQARINDLCSQICS